MDALKTYLAPIDDLLHDESVSEILINRVGEVWVERAGAFARQMLSAFHYTHLQGLATLIAHYSGQFINEKKPLLSAHLPSGHRVQMVMPPACAKSHIIMSIRKHNVEKMSLMDYTTKDAFAQTQISNLNFKIHQIKHSINENELQTLFHEKNFAAFLMHAIKCKKNILIAGGTSTGKTTFLNACLQSIPLHEHIITIEDVPEISMHHPLHTPLFISKGNQGLAQLSIQDLIQASLRLRPDRIILGEIRGAEAADFIHVASSGHEGSISSVHASSPTATFMRLVHLIKLSGIQLSRQAILDDLVNVIDVIVQLERHFDGEKYVRSISEIYYADHQ